MGTIYALVFTLTIILNSIEFSLQHRKSPIGDHPRGKEVSSSDRQDPVDISLPLASNYSAARSASPARPSSPARPLSPARSPSPSNPILRAKSRSPPPRFTVQPTFIDSSEGPQYGLEQLENIRLMPYENVHRVFELRKYSFPPDKGIHILAKEKVFGPVPTQEQIVLSTFDGDILAILEKNNVLTGIYASDAQNHRKRRAKINIQSGLVDLLTSEEIKEIPVGASRPLTTYFDVYKVDPANQNPIFT